MEPLKKTLSYEEMTEKVNEYMKIHYGNSANCIDSDKWFLHYGLMMDFIQSLWENK